LRPSAEHLQPMALIRMKKVQQTLKLNEMTLLLLEEITAVLL